MPEECGSSEATAAATLSHADSGKTAAAVRMTNGTSQRIRSIGTGITRQTQQLAHHHLHLGFMRFAGTDNCLLDLQGGVFRDRQRNANSSAYRRAAGLPQQQRGFGIDVDEYLLDGRALRTVLGNHLLQPFQQNLESFRKFTGAAAHAAAGDINKLLAGLVDDAKTGNPQTGVDA